MRSIKKSRSMRSKPAWFWRIFNIDNQKSLAPFVAAKCRHLADLEDAFSDYRLRTRRRTSSILVSKSILKGLVKWRSNPAQAVRCLVSICRLSDYFRRIHFIVRRQAHSVDLCWVTVRTIDHQYGNQISVALSPCGPNSNLYRRHHPFIYA
jgi:hypothetical protein